MQPRQEIGYKTSKKEKANALKNTVTLYILIMIHIVIFMIILCIVPVQIFK